MSTQTQRENLRTLVRGTYDLQKLRISTGNRIVANFKAKLGQAPSKPEGDLDAEEKQVLTDIRRSYKRITDGVASFPRQATFKGDEIISSYTELCLIAEYMELEATETRHFRRLESVLKDFPIYNRFLEGVRGVGPAMAGVIISEFNIHKAQYPSSLWKYAGLDVAEDGKGRSRKKEHLVTVQYTDKNGDPAERLGITFNPFLKTKLIGVLGSSFLRAGAGPYRKIYDEYKFRLECREDWSEESKGHRHNAAIRYMVKMFLIDLYKAWRALEGLPVAPDYSEAKLGKRHKAA